MDFHDHGNDAAAERQVDTSSPVERRLVMRLLRHWQALADGRAMPARTAIVPQQIAEMWSFCWIAAVRGAEPVFTAIGDAYRDENAEALIGHPLSAASPYTLIGKSTEYHAEVLAQRVPISTGGELPHQDGRLLLYRSIVLPLGRDGKTIDHLLGAANCRAVAA